MLKQTTYLHPMTRFTFTMLSMLTLAGVAVLQGCTKYDPFVGYAYDCECGSIQWDGRETGMRLAEAESLGGNVWRYHIVTDIRNEQELESQSEPRDLALTLTTNFDGSFLSLAIDEQDTALVVQQIDAPGVVIPWEITSANLQLQAADSTHNMTINSIVLAGTEGSVELKGNVDLAIND